MEYAKLTGGAKEGHLPPAGRLGRRAGELVLFSVELLQPQCHGLPLALAGCGRPEVVERNKTARGVRSKGGLNKGGAIPREGAFVYGDRVVAPGEARLSSE